ncbi:MAG: hypothetical protein IKD76_01355 [Clostridia bacterium]|nr:hypothetical protein [Clostridia bacterium]
MIYDIKIYFMMFIIYSVLGWGMECILIMLQEHKFVNRGFLIGPCCPIYGIGVVGVSILLTRFSNNVILLFALCTILCGSLEYFTSYIMEKIFKARWWDYSKNKFNINGRVCLETLIPFGFISVVIIKYINPWILDKLYMMPVNALNCLVISILLIFVIDFLVSFNVILRFKNLTKQEKDNTEEITKKVKETADAVIAKLNLEKTTLIKKMNISKIRLAKNIKYTRKKYTNKIKNQHITLIGSFKYKIEAIDEKIKNVAKDLTDKIASIKDNQLNFTKLKEKFGKESKLNKRLISAFPDMKQREYTRKKR